MDEPMTLWRRVDLMRRRGDTYRVISDTFTAEGIPTISGKGKWWGQTVRQFYVQHRPKDTPMTGYNQHADDKIVARYFEVYKEETKKTKYSDIGTILYHHSRAIVSYDEKTHEIDTDAIKAVTSRWASYLTDSLAVLTKSGYFVQTDNKTPGHRRTFLNTEIGRLSVEADNNRRAKTAAGRRKTVALPEIEYNELLELRALVENSTIISNDRYDALILAEQNWNDVASKFLSTT